jgi:hypothetical protein
MAILLALMRQQWTRSRRRSVDRHLTQWKQRPGEKEMILDELVLVEVKTIDIMTYSRAGYLLVSTHRAVTGVRKVYVLQ